MSRSSRKRAHSRRTKRSMRQRKVRGGSALLGAPLADSLANSWSSKMSMGQGADFFSYQPKGQQGGAHFEGAPLSAMGETLPAALQGPAMMGSLQRSFQEIAGLKDQAGGRRKKRSTKRSKSRKARKTRKASKSRKSRKGGKRSKRSMGQSACSGGRRSRRASRTRRSRGGALGFSPFPSAGLFDIDHSRAGLSPSWSGNVEFDAAKARQAL